MTSYWPQLVYIGVCLVGIGICLARDGEQKTGEHSFWADLIASSLIWFLLYMGGFFKGLL